MVQPQLLMRQAAHKVSYGARMALMNLFGPPDLPEPADPVKQMRKEQDRIEEQDARDIRTAEQVEGSPTNVRGPADQERRGKQGDKHHGKHHGHK